VSLGGPGEVAVAEPATTRREPGDLLLGIVPIGAILVLLLNDQLLKRLWPGPITGKLSDAAGLVFFPFLLVALWELVTVRRTNGSPRVRPVIVATAATGLVFVAVKLTSVGAELYRSALGLLQWPADALVAIVSGSAVPIPTRVDLAADPADVAMTPALALPLLLGVARRGTSWSRVEGRTVGLDPLDLAVSGLGAAMYCGAVVDGWAHTHLPEALETILTPWHAIVYASFSLLVATVAGVMFAERRSRPRARLLDLLPPGYGVTIVGIAVFLAAGIGDSLWHVAFGLEADAAALVSPTHLLLGVGAGLVVSGPIRRAWLSGAAADWPLLLPAVLGVAVITGLVAFATHLAHPLVDPWPVFSYEPNDRSLWSIAALGIASVALQAAILAGGLAALGRLWPLAPTGALAIVVIVSNGPLVFLHDEGRMLWAVLAAALVAEIASAGLRGGGAMVRLVGIGALTPAAAWAAEIAILAVSGEVRWSAHLLGGALVIAAICGGLVGLIAALPAGSEGVEQDRVH
jgi:hypothetical protein